MSFVSILMGSESDMDVMKKAAAVLDEFGIEHEMQVTSAHRKPRALVALFVASRTTTRMHTAKAPSWWSTGSATGSFRSPRHTRRRWRCSRVERVSRFASILTWRMGSIRSGSPKRGRSWKQRSSNGGEMRAPHAPSV